MFLRVMLIKQ